MVVDDVCEMVCRQFVGTLIEHLVIEDVGLDTHISAYHIVHVNLLARLYLEADNILFAVVDKCVDLLLSHGERVAHHHSRVGVILEVLYLVALGLQLFGSVERDICFSGFKKLVYIFLIYLTALALTVRTLVATETYAFIKLDSEPTERLQYVFFRTGNKPV